MWYMLCVPRPSSCACKSGTDYEQSNLPSDDNVEWRAYQAMLFSSSGVYLCDDGPPVMDM